MMRNLVYILFLFGLILLCSNCAKRGAPSGGPRDTIPPMIVKSDPENFSTLFTKDEIRIYFDEYIKLNDLQQNLIISPPLKYQPIITPLNTSKVLKIKFLDTLRENTTYSINFGNSIVDNNEQNVFKYYKYVFSTGDYIDSLTVKGQVKDALLAQLDDPVTVMLYELTEDYTDSIIFKEKPSYITTTPDSLSTFELTNLREGNYLLLALQEGTANYTFEPKSDKVGFHPVPVRTPNDSSYTITLFKEELDYQLTRPSHVGKNKIVFGYEGNADSLKISPITAVSQDFESKSYFDRRKDSLLYFFKPSFDPEVTDTVVFAGRNLDRTDTLEVRIRDLYPDSLDVTRVGSGLIIPRDSIRIQFNNPLVAIDTSYIQIMDRDSTLLSFKSMIDEVRNQAVLIFDKTDEQQYSIDILPNAFTDYFENTNDTLAYGVRTNELSDYGELGMELVNVRDFPIIAELVSSKYEVVATRRLKENKPLYFDYLSPDSYYFRLIIDANDNGVWDTGNFLDRRQPETVIYFPRPIEIRPYSFVNEIFELD